MTRRLFYIALGATVGVIAVRRITAAANRWTPQGIAAQAGGIGQRAAALVQEVREYAAERETELRAGLLGESPAGAEDDDGARS